MTELHWVNGPWPGKLALSARPRGGEWLKDEMIAWRREGVDTVFSLLTTEEERDLDLLDETSQARAQGLKFLSFPILDRQVPDSDANLTRALEKLDRELNAGNNVVLHCRQGIGRIGLVAACLLLTKGVDPDRAILNLTDARGIPIPETPEQLRWIERYAESFAGQR